MVKILLLSAAISVDAVGLGISLGTRRIRLDVRAVIAMSLTSLVIPGISVFAGSIAQRLVSCKAGDILSGLILIVMGVWIMLQGLKAAESTPNAAIKIIRSPDSSDIDKSGSIDIREAFFTGLALSLDSVAIGLAVGDERTAALLPPVSVIMQLVFIKAGEYTGKGIAKKFDTKICTLLSGALVAIIGILGII